MDIQQYYEVLELDPEAPSEDVFQAYKDLANVWHPDRFSKIPRLRAKAEKKLKEINEAYEKLQSYLSNLEQLKREKAAQIGAYGHAISRDIADEKTKKASRNLSRKYPLARCLARFIDYLLFGLLMGCLNVYAILLRLDIPAPLFPIISTFAWVFVEATLLCALGTSPGKWLLKTTIIDKSLKRPGYFGALRRSLSVWCNGMGTGIFFIAPVTMAISYQRFRKEGYAPWDREGKFSLIHRKVSGRRFFFAFLLFVTFSLLNTYEIHNQIDFMSVNMMASKSLDGKAAQKGETASVAQEPAAQKRQEQATDDYVDAQYRLGKACYELSRYKEAIEALKQVVRIRPGFAEAQYGLGVSYANIRHYSEATKALVQAIQLKPHYAEAHHILGFVYLNIGNKKAALTQHQILKGLDKDLANELLAYIDIPAPAKGIAPKKKPLGF
jgi:tetratricopeptide (TPR) repeat protein